MSGVGPDLANGANTPNVLCVPHVQLLFDLRRFNFARAAPGLEFLDASRVG